MENRSTSGNGSYSSSQVVNKPIILGGLALLLACTAMASDPKRSAGKWWLSVRAGCLMNVPIGTRYNAYPDTAFIPFRDISLAYYRSASVEALSWYSDLSVGRDLCKRVRCTLGFIYVNRLSKFVVADDTLKFYTGTAEVQYASIVDHRRRLELIAEVAYHRDRLLVSGGVGSKLTETATSRRVRAIDGGVDELVFKHRVGVARFVPFVRVSYSPLRQHPRWSIETSCTARTLRKFDEPSLDFVVMVGCTLGRWK